jgi:hypothetical protein
VKESSASDRDAVEDKTLYPHSRAMPTPLRQSVLLPIPASSSRSRTRGAASASASQTARTARDAAPLNEPAIELEQEDRGEQGEDEPVRGADENASDDPADERAAGARTNS